MKRLAAFLTAALLCAGLCACAQLVPSSYSSVTPYTETQPEPEIVNPDMRLAANMAELKQAIRSFVEGHIEHGLIRVYSYTGDVEDDLTTAAYQVAREDPYGAYAVDYITHSCSLIVSYYEIEIDITFRPDIVSSDALSYAISTSGAKKLIEQAIDQYEDHLVLYLTYYNSELDVQALAAAYCAQAPARLMAVPVVQTTMYPENGQSRILDIRFSYPHDAATLRDMAKAVDESLEAASVYVRYRQSEHEKAALLFTYLLERLIYVEAESQTPVYALFCEGLVSNQGAAVSWQLLCDAAGLDCITVSGMRAGNAYLWNILQLDGVYYHVDIFRDLLAGEALNCRSDADMTDYYWDVSQYPACPPLEPEEQEPVDAPDESDADTPSEDVPDAEPDSGTDTPPADAPQQPEPDGASPDTPHQPDGTHEAHQPPQTGGAAG